MTLLTKHVVVSLVFLFAVSGCGAVRMAGRVSSATGNAMVQSADEEEAKDEKKKAKEEKTAKQNNEQQTSTSSAGIGQSLMVKKNHATVNVRSEPSTKNTIVATLAGGDRVDKIGERSNWVKIRFNINGNQGEGWIRKDMVE